MNTTPKSDADRQTAQEKTTLPYNPLILISSGAALLATALLVASMVVSRGPTATYLSVAGFLVAALAIVCALTAFAKDARRNPDR